MCVYIIFNNWMHRCFHIFPRGGHHEDDLLQHPSPVAGQHGFCSSFQRGHRWLISAALEANADIDTRKRRTPTSNWTEAGWAVVVKTYLLTAFRGSFEDDLCWSSPRPGQSHHRSVTQQQHLDGERGPCSVSDRVLWWQSWTVQLSHT